MVNSDLCDSRPGVPRIPHGNCTDAQCGLVPIYSSLHWGFNINGDELGSCGFLGVSDLLVSVLVT